MLARHALARPHDDEGHAGTLARAIELFAAGVEGAVSERNPAMQDDLPRETDSGDTWRRNADAKLAGLYQAALEEPIPEDMLRLVTLIGAQGAKR